MKNYFLSFCVLTLLGAKIAAQNPEEGLQVADVMSLQVVTSLKVSPDGKWVAFTRTAPRKLSEAAGGSRNHLFIADVDGQYRERLLIGGKKSVRGLAFSPDGQLITFVDRREGAAHSEVYALPMNGGEARRLTHSPNGVSSYAWHPGGNGIAFIAKEAAPKARAEARRKGFQPVVVDEDYDHLRLWYWDADDGSCTQITKTGSVMSFQWSDDSKMIACAIAAHNLTDDRYVGSKLHLVDVAKKQTRLLVDNPGKLGDYRLSPNNDRLAWIGAVDVRDPHAGMLHITGINNGKTNLITEKLKGMIHQVRWRDADHLLAVASFGTKTQVGDFDLKTGKIIALGGGQGLAFRHVEYVPGQPASVICAASSARHPAEVFRLFVDGRVQRITHSNPWLEDLALGKQETRTIKSRDGLPIEGILHYPIGHDASKTYPMVVVVHGGPEAHFSEGWNTSYGQWGQLLSARGYFSWYPNYRSSTGYGVTFAKKDHGDPMGAEFDDHLDAIAIFAKEGLIDAKRVGIGGGSYGGYTAAWAATKQSQHFAAAVSFVPFTDIRTKWYTSDIPKEFFHVHYEEKWPHEQLEFLASRSPLSFAKNCQTPLLLLGGDADPRVHPSQPFMLYRAVKTATKTPVRYVKYPGEGHGNRKDKFRFDYALRTLRWFDHYLKAGDHRQDIPPALDVDYSSWQKVRR